ncbi:hypothetical protein H8R18_00720 [Nanchangia anserum]|uniref:Gram-positive cocci surface proteins LPxTG domain-containing protein n=1 Tax=Nanchangia anserum TaxID=2692125 RepID=A0A8I0KRV1_9ACTO|nr:hypothetical protein [Nanchangia anserum]MBD3689767.1 hypothetical protein [Nanchangia anserum]QOX81938.1 hypothetical protein H8R18_00720 [Nanchangia anserum]
MKNLSHSLAVFALTATITGALTVPAYTATLTPEGDQPGTRIAASDTTDPAPDPAPTPGTGTTTPAPNPDPDPAPAPEPEPTPEPAPKPEPSTPTTGNTGNTGNTGTVTQPARPTTNTSNRVHAYTPTRGTNQATRQVYVPARGTQLAETGVTSYTFPLLAAAGTSIVLGAGVSAYARTRGHGRHKAPTA